MRALRDETTRVLAVDLYAQLHGWVSDAIRRGIASGEFSPADVDDLSTLVLSLSDGYGIRLMLRDPTVTSTRRSPPSGVTWPARSACRPPYRRTDARPGWVRVRG